MTEWEPTVELESGTVSGKTLVCNRLVDAGIVLLVTILSLEALSLELGVAFGSLIAVGGASSVVVALACQEPLRHLINGLLLAFSDKFEPGDEIMFDDVAGFCTSMGWFDTSVRRGVEREKVPIAVGERSRLRGRTRRVGRVVEGEDAELVLAESARAVRGADAPVRANVRRLSVVRRRERLDSLAGADPEAIHGAPRRVVVP